MDCNLKTAICTRKLQRAEKFLHLMNILINSLKKVSHYWSYSTDQTKCLASDPDFTRFIVIVMKKKMIATIISHKFNAPKLSAQPTKPNASMKALKQDPEAALNGDTLKLTITSTPT